MCAHAPTSTRPPSSAECVAHPGPEALSAIHWHALLHFAQLLNELFLALGQPLRRPQLNANMQVSGSTRIHTWQSAPAQMKDLTALRTRRYTQRDAAGHSGNVDVGTEHELCVRDQDLGIEIFSVALEARIVGHLEHHMDVAARATTGAHISHAAQRHVLTGSDAAGNVHGNVSIGADAAVSPALLAGRTD